MDAPIAPPHTASSLSVGPNGQMWPLKWFLGMVLLLQARSAPSTSTSNCKPSWNDTRI